MEWSRDVNIFPLKVVNSKGSGSNIGIAIAINEVINYHKNKKNNVPSVINYSLGMMPSPKYPNYYPDETGDDVVTLDALKLATAFGIHVVACRKRIWKWFFIVRFKMMSEIYKWFNELDTT